LTTEGKIWESLKTIDLRWNINKKEKKVKEIYYLKYIVFEIYVLSNELHKTFFVCEYQLLGNHCASLDHSGISLIYEALQFEKI
jgi:hypothetical protein